MPAHRKCFCLNAKFFVAIGNMAVRRSPEQWARMGRHRSCSAWANDREF